MPPFKLAVAACEMAQEEQRALGNALRLALAWLGDGWSLVAPDQASQANLLIVAMDDTSRSAALWSQCRTRFPLERMVACGAAGLPEDARWCFQRRRSEKAPSVLGMVGVLRRVSASLADLPPPGARLNPADHIQGLVAEALADGISRSCKLPNGPELYLLPREKSFYVMEDIERIIPLCLARREQLTITPISEDELLRKVGYIQFSSRLSKYTVGGDVDVLQEIGFKKARRYSLNELLWFATLVNSQGRLLDGCDGDEPVHIRNWPEFTRLPYYRDYLDLSKFMSTRALRLADIAAETGTPPHSLVDFHNACALLGLLERGPAAQQHAEQQQAAHRELCQCFKPIGAAHKGRVKIVIAGTVGAGKTTAITTLSDFAPITTETRPSDKTSDRKPGTTVAMDYGEIRFDDMKIFLFGTPGQRRFDFMGQILSPTAWGLLILIDNTENDPLAELDYYFQLYGGHLAKLRVAVGVTHYDASAQPSLEDYGRYLGQRQIHCPVLPADPRKHEDMVRLLRSMIE